jgi:cysteine desulfurase
MDNHATTRVDPRVLEAMLPLFTTQYGNPASKNHSFGWEADERVQSARAEIAQLIGAADREIVITSGATESNNLAIKGAAHAYRQQGDHLISVTTEHKAVLDPLKRLEHEGFRVTVLPVDREGMLDPADVLRAIEPKTILVSVMAANNEIGVLHALAEIGRICKERGVLFHSDAAQALGKITLDVEEQGLDLVSLSAHKLYGPKGVGALYVRRRGPQVRLEPQIDGGGHERGLRSGTLPAPLIVGFGAACAIARDEMLAEGERLLRLRERLQRGLMDRIPEVSLNGHATQRLPGNLNLSFAGVKGEALLVALKEVALSTGSACTTANLAPSHVLKAIGLDDDDADASLRFGLGRFNTEEEIDWVIAHVAETVQRLRALSPEWRMRRARDED